MDIQIEKSYSTPLSNSTLLLLLLQSLASQKHSPSTSSFIKDEYDYIVVGGGAAGSVVASRLSEESCATVLVLEAGPEPPLLTEVPALSKYFMGTNLDWNFKTVPQKHAASSFKNNQVPYPTGKMLGGSAGFNYMAYVRGNKKDYDYWEELGASGWSYKDIFHYLIKLEDNRDSWFLADGQYHATGGPITMEQPRYNPALKQAASEAAIRMGYKFVDSNGKQQTGFYDLQANLRNNQRCSPLKGYLVPAEERSNLDIFVNAFVTRLIIEDGKVTAVEFFNGKYHQIKVKKEVIMTAGSVNTPKILMLSGVGPREELNKINIPVVADLPVGKNFHDHCGTDYFFTMNPCFRSMNDTLSDPASIMEYIEFRSGPLSSTKNLLIAFLYGPNAIPVDDFPNYNVFVCSNDNTLSKSATKPEVYQTIFKNYENKPIFRCAAQVLHTRSRGTITLNSSNPFDPPLIDPNYLEHPGDLEDIVDGLKFCKKLLTTEPLLRLGAKPLQFVVPGCEMHSNDEEEYLRCYVRTLLFNFNDHVGSTKMGDPSNLTTVVDPELKVKGIKGLRVADASVMPQVTSGATLIPVLVIAEKASHMIKESMTC